MTPVLLLEDDRKIALEVISQLEEHGYLVTHLRTISQTKAVDFFQFYLLIFDWNLPDGEGVELVRGLRAKNIDIPILMLSARNQLDDRKKAMDCGATDFLGKPFYFHELLARVSQLANQAVSSKNASELIESSGISIKLFQREVIFEGEPVNLTKKEFDLLVFFVRSPRVVFSRDEILDSVWGRDEAPTNRTVDTHVLQLRKKINADLFETVWSTGYRFLPREESS